MKKVQKTTLDQFQNAALTPKAKAKIKGGQAESIIIEDVIAS